MTGDPTRVVPRPASTVALLRSGADGLEVLLTHRPATMAFGPGLHVFPGGAVDPDDADGVLASRSVLDAATCAELWALDLEPEAALGHAVAAVRELYEEAGVLLASHRDESPVDGHVAVEAAAHGTALSSLVQRLDLVLRTDRLVPLACWVTPPVDTPRRYHTRFFAAWLPDGAAVAHHGDEVVAHAWLTPSAALERYAAGEIDLWPPTSTTLAQLEGIGSLDEVRRTLAPVRAAPAPEVAEVVPGLLRVRLGSGGGIPGRVTDAWVVGHERVVVVDPGDPTEAGLDAILGTVNRHGTTIAAVAVTSAAPDRVAGAVGLALVAGVPLHAPPGAVARIGEPAQALEAGGRITDGDLELVAGAVGILAAPRLGVVLPMEATPP